MDTAAYIFLTLLWSVFTFSAGVLVGEGLSDS